MGLVWKLGDLFGLWGVRIGKQDLAGEAKRFSIIEIFEARQELKVFDKKLLGSQLQRFFGPFCETNGLSSFYSSVQIGVSKKLVKNFGGNDCPLGAASVPVFSKGAESFG